MTRRGSVVGRHGRRRLSGWPPVRAALAAGATCLVVLGVVGPVFGASPPVADAAVAPAKFRLSGSATALPPGAAVVGSTPGSAEVDAEVSMEPRDPSALQAFVDAVSTPGSPEYRHYLAKGRFGSVFGPTAATLVAVRAWLSSVGLHLGATSTDGLLIPVSGTADQMERAFGVPLVETRLRSGRLARAPTADPEVPASLAGVIGGVIGLSTVAQSHPQIVPGPQPEGEASDGGTGAVSPRTTLTSHQAPVACAAAADLAGAGGGWTAQQLASTYGLSSLYQQGRFGAGQRVGIYELESFTPSDIAAYQSCYGSDASVSTVDVDGGATGSQVGEAALDIEVVAGLAPLSSITVFSGPNGGSGPLDTYRAMVDDDAVRVVTTSWGDCEGPGGISPAEQAAENHLFEVAKSQGQTVLAAAGDAGSSDCYDPGDGDDNRGLAVDDPAVQPLVTGVGGTSLTSPVSTPSTETVWNDEGGAGGGGNSVDFAAGTYQQIPEAQTYAVDHCSSTIGAPGSEQCREVPDVSASSDPAHGDPVFFDGGWRLVGGTSAAAPLWAALTADINQGCATPVGFENPLLYTAGSGASPPFNDITEGDNSLFGAPADYPAAAGYDLASGWGSPRAAQLLTLFSGSSAGCPSVTGLSPNAGPATGGRSVVVEGVGFGTGSPQVHFGPIGVPVVAHTPTSITVVTPDVGSATTLPVTVTTSGTAAGTSAAVPASQYTFISPRISSVVPDKGPTSGGTEVTVTGSDFGRTTAVFFGGTVSPSFTVLSATSLIASVPPGPSGGGVVNVAVRSPDGTSPRVPADQYIYALPGYWLVASDGGIFAYGDAGFHGSTGDIALNRPVVGMATTLDDRGYWLVASDGGIFAFGDAHFHGSTGDIALNKPVVGMAATPDGGGYWLVASDGGIFAFGDAHFYGSTGATALNKPIVGMASTPDGKGYWLVASDGGIFAYGDAAFHGSTGNITLNKPVVGMAATPDGRGYWLVASDGGIFAYGDARFYGSTGNITLNKPVVGMARSLSGRGYWLVASDGGIFAYGDARFYGSTGNIALVKPVVGMAAT